MSDLFEDLRPAPPPSPLAQAAMRRMAYLLSHVHIHQFINEETGVAEWRELRHVHPWPQAADDEHAARVHTHAANGVEHVHPHGHEGYVKRPLQKAPDELY